MNEFIRRLAVTVLMASWLVVPASRLLAAGAEPVVPFRAEPFALQDVRLLDGPFKTAMQRDGKYLLDLDPDRLLHSFRVTAGMPSTAEPMGGWESPKTELRGHLVGHYLSGCALMYASTGDERFKDRSALLVRELAKCQSALGNSGYLSAFPESFFDRLETTGKVWAPYYTLHKVLAGLLDAHALCADPLALDVATRFGNWVCARTDRLTDEQLQKALDVEHGGINESMANLYALTGEQRYLRAARRLCHKRVLDPLAAREDKLAGLHANTQFPKLIGAARLYELTGEQPYRTMAEFFWDRVVHHHSYATGSNSDHEHFGPPDQLFARVSPFTAESCNTYNMLKLTNRLFAWSAAADQADYYERALYNHILATQDPRTGMMAYHIPLYGGWFMPYNTPTDSCWCCTGTGFENHARYGESIYWHDAQGLLVNLFIPSELMWRARGMTVRQETRYPEEDATRLTFRSTEPVTMSLRIRYPAWAARGMEVKVNHQPFAHSATPGSYVAILRTWSAGDTVEVKLPMGLRLEPMPDNPARAAVCYGPVVLAGELGAEGIVPPMPYAHYQGDFFGVAPPRIPCFVTDGLAVGQWLEPVPGRPLTFRTKSVGRPRDVRLVAFYSLTPQRYSIYWDVLTSQQWDKRQAELEQQARREAALAPRTVDSAGIGNPAQEKAHNLKGHDAHADTFNDRPYRDTRDGGWFSYDLKLPPQGNNPASLLVAYWGSDSGARTFDVLVDNTPIATVHLNNDHPGEFFDVVYEIPPRLSSGKSQVTVKFRAHAGAMAGGVYDLRVLSPLAADGPATRPVRRILFLGNSITRHGPKADIGWTGNWGMAASALEKDYVHVLVAELAARTGAAPEFLVDNIADFERKPDAFDYAARLEKSVAFGADVIVLAIGENVPALQTDAAKDAFRQNLRKLLAALKGDAKPAIFVRSCFWVNAAKDDALRDAAREAGATFVDISAAGADPANKASSERQIAHAGVANHPGDRGMKEIAGALFKAIAERPAP